MAIFTHGKIHIRTEYDPPPIPDRSCDWSAVDDRTYDGEGCPIGWGATEADAIDALYEQLLEGCTCTTEPVHSASFGPAAMKPDIDCPLHGWRDPDREREDAA